MQWPSITTSKVLDCHLFVSSCSITTIRPNLPITVPLFCSIAPTGEQMHPDSRLCRASARTTEIAGLYGDGELRRGNGNAERDAGHSGHGQHEHASGNHQRGDGCGRGTARQHGRADVGGRGMMIAVVALENAEA